MDRPLFSRLDPRAAKYLHLLVEFGHLDTDGAERVLVLAAESWAGSDRVPLSFVRRIAASAVFTGDIPVDGGSDVLSADWPLLFH